MPKHQSCIMNICKTIWTSILLFLSYFVFKLHKLIPKNPLSQLFNKRINDKLNHRLRRRLNRRLREDQPDCEPECLTDREVLTGLLKSKVIFLDYNEIEDGIPDWQNMQSQVDIEFLGRDIDAFWLLYNKHGAWLVKGANFLCIIEYAAKGIMIQYFETTDINRVCAAMLGTSKNVHYNDTYQTNMSFAQILNYVNQMKSYWRGCDFKVVSHNCGHFVRELGKKMDSSYNEKFLKERFIGVTPFEDILNV